ncbi:hypothetical protein VIGAN_UM072000 [Vigna angularis var. angularis]|uniref:Uncharacterized protein n=1 Tax=Vigna angularis var. angularis TaxID=157739 RepID=A0A0S3TDX1_PHAAN|nr:hypothetical protein VIGAN_UM072000 [Vigna angularis var. angularis]
MRGAVPPSKMLDTPTSTRDASKRAVTPLLFSWTRVAKWKKVWVVLLHFTPCSASKCCYVHPIVVLDVEAPSRGRPCALLQLFE